MALSVWQLKRQIAFLAAAAVWAETPGAVVLTGGAVVSEDLEGAFAPGSFLLDGPLPATLSFGRVSCRGIDMDDDQPSRISRARFYLFFTAGGGWPFPIATGTNPPLVDSHGINMENASLRNPVNPQGNSDGRSADELIARFFETTVSEKPGTFVNDRHGFQGRFTRGDEMQAVNGVQTLKRAARIDVLDATLSNYYHPPHHMRAVGPTTAHISWLNPPTRFDTFKNELWRGTNSGDPAPTTRSGTQIALGSNLAASATDAPGPGTWGYTVFHTYTETPTAKLAAVADRASIGVSSVVVL